MGTLKAMRRLWVVLVWAGVLTGLMAGWAPLLAQSLPTPTPDADGNIYVVVQPNDSMWSIAARAGISLPTLLELNDLTENSVVRPGDRLLIGRVEPLPTVTPEPSPTATLGPPTPTRTPPPLPPTSVCLTAFDDLNQDGIHDGGEPLRGAVAFTIFTEQAVVANYITDGLSEPRCLELEPGSYRITRSIGRDETLSNDGDVAVLLNRGSVVQLFFGSYRGAAMVGATAVSGTPSPATPLPVFIQATLPGETAVSPTKPTPPNLLAWGALALAAVLTVAALIFAIRLRRQ
ncbi:MAG: LysM peptidoglycan-binding domain-containing protein [Chloroflexi bacterium]|nr:LysM peptidoglycan-binding domain-containing protein [Chloroflexota bacterium]